VSGSDRILIAECLAGRSSAFGELVLRYQDRLYNAVLRIVDNSEDAQDVVQDSFVNAYQSLASFKGESEFYTWLYRIAFNAAVTLKRRRKTTMSIHQAVEGGVSLEPADCSLDISPDASLERFEEETKLYQALKRLSVEHRSVLVMNDIDGMKYEQIAEVMGVPIGTVRSRIHRARLELRALLEVCEVPEEQADSGD
jgi:RNA polymerase sigma-70 factor, ECF subfamily